MSVPEQVFFRHTVSEVKPGKFTQLHCHNGLELLYIVSGDMNHIVEGRRYRLEPGDLVLVHPSRYHYLEQMSESIYERYNIHFDPQLHDVDISQLPKEMEVVNLTKVPFAPQLFEKMGYYQKLLDDATFDKMLLQMLNELFINLQLSADIRKQEEVFLPPVLKGALDYINENLYTISDVDQVADAMFISTSYLFFLFRSVLRQTPKRYITEKRLLAAQRKIRSGMLPTVAFKDCGFNEYATFYRSYCAFFGYPPSRDSKYKDVL